MSFVVRNGVRFPDASMKNGADDAYAELPGGVVVVEHKDGELSGFAGQGFGFFF